MGVSYHCWKLLNLSVCFISRTQRQKETCEQCVCALYGSDDPHRNHHPRDLQWRTNSRKPQGEKTVAACNSTSFSHSLRSMTGMDNNLRRDTSISSYSFVPHVARSSIPLLHSLSEQRHHKAAGEVQSPGEMWEHLPVAVSLRASSPRRERGKSVRQAQLCKKV